MSSVQVEAIGTDSNDIPFQAASLDIWDKKYRLKSKTGAVIDETIDDTFKRVAHALADVEESEENKVPCPAQSGIRWTGFWKRCTRRV
jgi:ribonucleoside-diphosphate reductase alpha chain